MQALSSAAGIRTAVIIKIVIASAIDFLLDENCLVLLKLTIFSFPHIQFDHLDATQNKKGKSASEPGVGASVSVGFLTL